MKKTNSDLKNLTLKQKLKKAIPGFIVGIFMISLFVYFIRQDNKCEKSLDKNGTVIQMYAKLSEKKVGGNGSLGVYTLFTTIYNGEEIIAKSNSFLKPIPVGMPIYVLYSFDCDDCAKIIYDSIIEYQGHLFKNEYFENQGYKHKIIKL